MGRYDLDTGKHSNKWVIIAGIAVVITVALIFWFSGREDNSQSQVETPITLPEAPPEVELPLSIDAYYDDTESAGDALNKSDDGTAVEIEQEVIEEQDLPQLPKLANSDTAFKEDMLGLSEGLKPWLNTQHVIRKFLVIINDFSQGLRIHKHMSFMTLNQPFKVGRDRHGLFMDPAGYHRYDALAKAIDGIDVPVAMVIYDKYRPLLLEVFSGFGYPDSHQLEDLFRKSAAEILEAPVIKDRISLYRPSVRYKFSSPKLESLSPVQKQMIRMGPDNTLIIQHKVRSLIEALINRPNNETITFG